MSLHAGHILEYFSIAKVLFNRRIYDWMSKAALIGVIYRVHRRLEGPNAHEA